MGKRGRGLSQRSLARALLLGATIGEIPLKSSLPLGTNMPGEVPKLYKKWRIHACLRMMCWMRTNKQHSWLPAGGRTSNIRLPWIVVLVNHSR